MSATDHIRALLDECMGTTRAGTGPKIEFTHPRVCKSYLLDSCPNEILSGTALDHLDAFIRDCDQRTANAKENLRETQEELTDEATERAEQINALSEQISTKLAKAEQLGADGKVEESLQLMKEVEEISVLKSKSESDLRTAIPSTTYQQQKLRVCEVCSAYLGIHDNDRRLADHFGGKLHLGFIEIRNKLADLREYVRENNLVSRRKYEGCTRYDIIRDQTRRINRPEESNPRRSRSPSRSHHSNRRYEKNSRSSKHHKHSRRHNSRDRSRARHS